MLAFDERRNWCCVKLRDWHYEYEKTIIQNYQSPDCRHRPLGLAFHDVQTGTARISERRRVRQSQVFYRAFESAAGRRFPRLCLRDKNRPFQIRLHDCHHFYVFHRPPSSFFWGRNAATMWCMPEQISGHI